MSRLQQKRTGIRSTRPCMEAASLKTALNNALAHMGIKAPRWGSRPEAKSAIPNPQSAIPNPQSPIRNPRSPA
jgi:hypothetical protein